MGELLAKNRKNSKMQEGNFAGNICYLENNYYFVELNNPLSPKLARKHALLKMNLTLMEVSMF